MRIVQSNLIFLGLLLPLSASAVVCDPEPDRACPTEPVLKYCVTALDATCTTGKKALDIAFNLAPPVADTQAVCDYTSNRYNCEAWPKHGGVSYSWSVAGSLSFVSPPYLDDTASVNCTANGSNIIYLTVTSPFGMSTTVSAHLYCGYMGEY